MCMRWNEIHTSNTLQLIFLLSQKFPRLFPDHPLPACKMLGLLHPCFPFDGTFSSQAMESDTVFSLAVRGSNQLCMHRLHQHQQFLLWDQLQSVWEQYMRCALRRWYVHVVCKKIPALDLSSSSSIFPFPAIKSVCWHVSWTKFTAALIAHSSISTGSGWSNLSMWKSICITTVSRNTWPRLLLKTPVVIMMNKQ